MVRLQVVVLRRIVIARLGTSVREVTLLSLQKMAPRYAKLDLRVHSNQANQYLVKLACTVQVMKTWVVLVPLGGSVQRVAVRPKAMVLVARKKVVSAHKVTTAGQVLPS